MLMVWAEFSEDSFSRITFLSGRQNAPNNLETLENYLVLFVDSLFQRTWKLYHDNAFLYKEKLTLGCLAANNINLMPWPGPSPDLNPIKNVLGAF